MRVDIPSYQKDLTSSLVSLSWSFLLSLVLIYMILAAQFESLTRPLLLMVSVPLMIVGIALALFLSGSSVNVLSVMGIVMSAGVAVNHAIVLMQCVDSNRASGMKLHEAVVRGTHARLEPIAMTTLAAILGLVPLVSGMSTGGEMEAPLAITMMGGLIGSTTLMLFVLPVFYYKAAAYFMRKKA